MARSEPSASSSTANTPSSAISTKATPAEAVAITSDAPTYTVPAGAGAVLTIDLGAVAVNWRTLRAMVGRADCAAVVKADGYGLGAARVGPVLEAAGCRHFFVAHLDEALALRPLLPPEAHVAVLNGLLPGTAAEFRAHGITPVLNSLDQISAWQSFTTGTPLPAWVHIDTGM